MQCRVRCLNHAANLIKLQITIPVLYEFKFHVSVRVCVRVRARVAPSACFLPGHAAVQMPVK